MVWFTNSNNVRVVAGTYQFFTGSIPTATGFEFLIESPANSTDLSDPYYAQFNQENRFINFANNLGTVGAGALKFQQEFGALTFEQTIRKAYGDIVGMAEAQAAGINPEAAIQFFLNSMSFYQAVAQERVVPGGVSLDQATKIVALGSIINEAIKAGVGKYATAVTELVTDVSGDGLSNLLGTSIVNAVVVPSTFLLTQGEDFADAQGSFRNGPQNATDFKFTAASEIITATAQTITDIDVLSDPSQADNDVLNIAASGTTQGNILDLGTVANIETINVVFSNFGGQQQRMDFDGVTGAKTLDLDGTLANDLELITILNSGITTIDGSGLISAGAGFFVTFDSSVDNLGRNIVGSAGGDQIGGSQVADTLFGGAGDDVLIGFGGNDTIRGGSGADVILSTGGSDRVVFEATAAANGQDTFGGPAVGFTPGAGGDIADFSAFLGGAGVVLEVLAGTVGIQGVDATGSNIIIFDNDPNIDDEGELEALIGAAGLNIGANRNVVVVIQNGDSEAYYVHTNAAGEAAPDDVNLVATFQATVSIDFVPGNFV